MRDIVIEGLRIIVFGALPTLGAGLIGGMLAGILKTLLRINEEILGYAFRLGACVICWYFLFPTFSSSLISFTENILESH